MSRRPDRGRVVATRLTALLIGAPLLAGCGGSGSSAQGPGGQTTPTSAGPTGALAISPGHPTTRSEITFGFTAPVASGRHGRYEIGYSLSVTGAARPGCVGAHEASAPSVARGGHATITLGPSQLGARWCAGPYTARAIELRSAYCSGSKPCPQFVAVVGIVARASYTVKRG